MRKIFLTSLLALSFLSLSLSPSLAQVKTKTAPIKLPVFAGGENQLIDKAVDSDLMVAGKNIKITSNVKGDTYVAGGQVDIGGTITGNLIVAGGEVTLSGTVAKNLIVAGGQVKIDTTASVGGYLLSGAGKLELLGKFAGPVKLGAGELSVGQKAVLNSTLEADVSKSDISSTAKIVGEKNIRLHETKKVDEVKKPVARARKLIGFGDIYSFLSQLVLLLLIVKFFAAKILAANEGRGVWATLGLALTILIVTPFVCLLFFITIIGIHLSWLTFSLYILILSISGVVTSIFVGDYLVKKEYLKTNNNYLSAFIGLVILSLIGLIPVVGGIVSFLAFLYGLGAITWSLKSQTKN